MKKLINCSACGNKISKTAKVCPSCGQKNKRIGLLGKIFLVFFSLMIFGMVVGSISSGSSSTGSSNISSKKYSSSNYSFWKKGSFVDEFGDNTGERYIVGEFPGFMYNTATNGSRARIEIFFKPNGKSFIRIYEYNRQPVSGYSRGTTYRFKFKGNGGVEKSFSWQWYEQNEIVFGPKNTATMKELFKNNNEIKLVVVNAERPTSNYKFLISGKGFTQTLNKLN